MSANSTTSSTTTKTSSTTATTSSTTATTSSTTTATILTAGLIDELLLDGEEVFKTLIHTDHQNQVVPAAPSTFDGSIAYLSASPTTSQQYSQVVPSSTSFPTLSLAAMGGQPVSRMAQSHQLPAIFVGVDGDSAVAPPSDLIPSQRIPQQPDRFGEVTLDFESPLENEFGDNFDPDLDELLNILGSTDASDATDATEPLSDSRSHQLKRAVVAGQKRTRDNSFCSHQTDEDYNDGPPSPDGESSIWEPPIHPDGEQSFGVRNLSISASSTESSDNEISAGENQLIANPPSITYTKEPASPIRPQGGVRRPPQHNKKEADGKRGKVKGEDAEAPLIQFLNIPEGVVEAEVTNSLVLPDGRANPDHELVKTGHNQTEINYKEMIFNVQDGATHQLRDMRIRTRERSAARNGCPREKMCRIKTEVKLFFPSPQESLTMTVMSRIIRLGANKMELAKIDPTRGSAAGGSLMYLHGKDMVNKNSLPNVCVVLEEIVGDGTIFWKEEIPLTRGVTANKELICVTIPPYKFTHETSRVEVYVKNNVTHETTAHKEFFYLPVSANRS